MLDGVPVPLSRAPQNRWDSDVSLLGDTCGESDRCPLRGEPRSRGTSACRWPRGPNTKRCRRYRPNGSDGRCRARSGSTRGGDGCSQSGNPRRQSSGESRRCHCCGVGQPGAAGARYPVSRGDRCSDDDDCGQRATSAALSPTVTHAMRKFAEKFAMGYGIARLKRQHCERVDFRTIRSWFRAHKRAGIPVTATGVVRDGRFWPGDCFADGVSAVLQGFFNPATKSLSDGRLLLNVRTVSSPVRKQHGGSGLAFYLSAPSGL